MDPTQQDIAFPATAWSLIGRARSSTPAERSAALQALLTRYLPALRVRLINESRLKEHVAEDMLQGFVTHKILEQDLIAHADQAKGRFRTFVLTALDRYVIDRIRYETAAKRSQAQSSSDALDTVAAIDPEPSRAFDLEWARQLIDEAVGRMQAHCEKIGRLDLWELFRCRVLEPALEGATPLPYHQLIERFGFVSPTAASNALVTAKRTFERSLRSVIAEYADDEAEVDRELIDLKLALQK
ncbi:MAG TPA: hypothetical protein VIM11_18050 [Tepidisphaeraceae bacterium]|jgi:RNA polymerase sigma-70 factor (ECF subfamily)